MFRIMLQKTRHKIWMILCLLLGSTLLIATAASFPLYRRAAFDRMLVDEFRNSLATEGQWPAQNEMTIISKKDKEGKSIARMEGLMSDIYNQLGVTQRNTVYYYSLAKTEAQSLMGREDGGDTALRLGYLSDLEEHITLCGGTAFSESGVTEEGSYEVLISQECMVENNLLLGESYQLPSLKDAQGEPIQITIMGIFDRGGEDAFYWQVSPEQLSNVCLMKENLFRENFLGEHAARYTLTCSYFAQFAYEDLQASQVEELIQQTQYLTQESAYRSTMSRPPYQDILESFLTKKTRIAATLFLLQIPVLVLLGAFLLMISGQMYEMERNEISVFKSRGSSSGQIFRLYLYQSMFLTAIGAVLGLPLGKLLSTFLGATRNFLEFDMSRALSVSYQQDMLGYLLGAAGVSILIMTVPAWKHSKVSIVNLKTQKVAKKRSWWERCFLDIICLGIAMYGYYSFSRNGDTLAQNVLRGESLDPLLYVSSSLFIIGAGLVFLRVQPLLIGLIYQLGKKFWHPASYASFQENRRTGKRQQSIMLFLILTIGLGMFHATVARTILQNALDNTSYLSGADVIIKEVWEDNSALVSADNTLEIRYYEPDIYKYELLDCAQSYTKVIADDKTYLNVPGGSRQDITLLGIHTKEFGEITDMPAGLLEKPYHEYLNALATSPDGILVSENVRTVLGYKVGDSITIFDRNKRQITGKIIDFFGYWPGYQPTVSVLNEDGSVSVTEQYLALTHFDVIGRNWGTVPYEVWIRLKENADTQEIARWIAESEVSVTKYSNRRENLRSTMEDPMLQGTNGVLTMGFLVTILLCAVGYLIYWILSIRSREMLFGVLRACGMHKGELFHMLMNEQIFSGVFSVLAGIGIGKVASGLFVPILQTAYMAVNQILPMQMITNAEDMFRLYSVIFGMMVVCFGILLMLVFGMNVTKALKLGED